MHTATWYTGMYHHLSHNCLLQMKIDFHPYNTLPIGSKVKLHIGIPSTNTAFDCVSVHDSITYFDTKYINATNTVDDLLIFCVRNLMVVLYDHFNF